MFCTIMASQHKSSSLKLHKCPQNLVMDLHVPNRLFVCLQFTDPGREKPRGREKQGEEIRVRKLAGAGCSGGQGISGKS